MNFALWHKNNRYMDDHQAKILTNCQEPVSFWLQVRHSNHWGAETQMENEVYINGIVWFICALPMRQSL